MNSSPSHLVAFPSPLPLPCYIPPFSQPSYSLFLHSPTLFWFSNCLLFPFFCFMAPWKIPSPYTPFSSPIPFFPLFSSFHPNTTPLPALLSLLCLSPSPFLLFYPTLCSSPVPLPPSSSLLLISLAYLSPCFFCISSPPSFIFTMYMVP